jgi:hypothetical protein
VIVFHPDGVPELPPGVDDALGVVQAVSRQELDGLPGVLLVELEGPLVDLLRAGDDGVLPGLAGLLDFANGGVVSDLDVKIDVVEGPAGRPTVEDEVVAQGERPRDLGDAGVERDVAGRILGAQGDPDDAPDRVGQPRPALGQRRVLDVGDADQARPL